MLDPLPTGSIDRHGLSVATATRDGTPRQGMIYSPARFAASVPVHFQPLGGTRYLGLFDGHWSDATPSAELPGHYSDYTIVSAPSAALINGATGEISPVIGIEGYALPVTNYSGLKLVSAASSFIQVFTLCSAVGKAVLGSWTLSSDDQLQSRSEHVIPDITADGQEVRFDAGVYLDGPWVYLWGRGLNDDRVYTCRQLISLLGHGWLYQTAVGWVGLEGLYDADNPRPATPVTGLTTEGPISTVMVLGNTYVTTVATSGSNKVGRIMVSKSMADPWTKLDEISLGPTVTWTGSGVTFQRQVPVNPGQVPSGAMSSVPYVKTLFSSVDDEDSLGVDWGLFPITST